MLGAGMVLDVVATLGGAVFATLGGATVATLGGVASSTLGAGSEGGGMLGAPDIIAVRRWIASRCLILSCADVGTSPPSCCRKAFAASNVASCSEMTGTWQWLGYRRQVSAKRKRRVVGI